MRRLLRIILWMVKGVLLVIALAALVMWPVSSASWRRVIVERYTVTAERAEWRLYHFGAQNGRLTLGRFVGVYDPNAVPVLIRKGVETGGQGWQWLWMSQPNRWNDDVWRSKWGPLRWDIYNSTKGSPSNRIHRFAAPLWLVALFTGAWPLLSIFLVIRRRIKRRRAVREGRCTHCGYDLRTTPDKSGALLAVCPECGQKTSAGNTPSPPPS
jgi:hypothetical protein